MKTVPQISHICDIHSNGTRVPPLLPSLFKA